MIPDDLFTWLNQRRRTLITLIIAGTIFVIGTNLFMSYAVIYIEVSSPSPYQSFTIHAVTEKKKDREQLGGQLAIISRDTKTLIVSSGSNIKTQSAIDIPWYGFVNEKVLIKPDLNAEKIAFRSTFTNTCPLYRPQSNTLAYYDCLKENRLIDNVDSASSRWASRVIYDIESLVKPFSSYMGGYIGIADLNEHDKPTIEYIRAVNEKGEVLQYETPQNLLRADLVNSRIYTDTRNTKNSRFVIVSNLGDIFIGTPLEKGKVDYKKISPPKEYDVSRNQTSCRLNSEKVYCYRGHWRIGDAPRGFDYSKTTASQVTVYSFVDKSEKTHKLSSNIAMIEDIYITVKGEIFGTDSKYLYHFAKTGDEYKPVKLAVYPTAVGAGDAVYYIHDNTVYQIDDKDASTAYQVFYSPNVIPKSVYSVDGNVYILGSNPKNKSVTFAYKLLDEPNIKPGKRLIDLLPDMTPANPHYYFSDLVREEMYFSLNLSNRNPSPQQFTEDFARQKENTLNSLRSLDIPINESKITFGY